MFFLGSSIGLYCTDTKLSVVSATGSEKAVQLAEQQSIDLAEGIMKNGVVQDVEKFAAALQSLELSTKKIAVCLPSDKVYLSQVTTAKSSGARQQKLIDTAVAKVIPEEFLELHVLTEKLHTTKEEITTGIIAIQKDIIQGYKDAFVKAGLELTHMTSLSVAAAGYVKKQNHYSLLVQGISASTWTLTVLYKGWPVDEAVIPASEDRSNLVKEAKELMDEFKEQGQVIASVDVIGDEALVKQLQAVVTTVKPEPVVSIEIPPAVEPEEIVEPEVEEDQDPPEEEESEEPGDDLPVDVVEEIVIQPFLEGLIEVDGALLEASIASLSSSRIESVNFLHKKNNMKNVLLLSLLAVGVILIGGAYLLRGFGYSIPIPFMAGDEGQTIVIEKTPEKTVGSGVLLENESGTGSSSASSVEIL